MWLLHTDGPVGCVTVLKHKEVAEERLWTIKVCLLPKGRPEVKGAADRFFCPIVKIVAKGRTDLGLGFYSSDQCPFTDNEKIPFFGRSEESRKFDRSLSENAVAGDSGLCDKFREKVNKPVHLRTARYGTSQPLIGLPTCFLFLPLCRSGLPVVGDRPGGTFSHLSRNLVFAHASEAYQIRVIYSRGQRRS